MKNLHHLAIGVGSFRAAEYLTSCQANYRGIIVCIVGFPRHLVFLNVTFNGGSARRLSLFI